MAMPTDPRPSWQASPRRRGGGGPIPSAAILFLGAALLCATFVHQLLAVLLAPGPLNEAWQQSVIQRLLSAAVLPVLACCGLWLADGLGLIEGPAWLRRALRPVALLAALGFLLIIPLRLQPSAVPASAVSGAIADALLALLNALFFLIVAWAPAPRRLVAAGRRRSPSIPETALAGQGALQPQEQWHGSRWESERPGVDLLQTIQLLWYRLHKVLQPRRRRRSRRHSRSRHPLDGAAGRSSSDSSTPIR